MAKSLYLATRIADTLVSRALARSKDDALRVDELEQAVALLAPFYNTESGRQGFELASALLRETIDYRIALRVCSRIPSLYEAL